MPGVRPSPAGRGDAPRHRRAPRDSIDLPAVPGKELCPAAQPARTLIPPWPGGLCVGRALGGPEHPDRWVWRSRFPSVQRVLARRLWGHPCAAAGHTRLSPTAGHNRQELSVPAEPCAMPSQTGAGASPGMMWSIPASLSSILPSRVAASGMCRQLQGRSCQELRVPSWGPSQGPIPGSQPSSRSPGSLGRLGGGWWMLGAQRFFMVSEGSINSLNIQPFQVGFVEN